MSEGETNDRNGLAFAQHWLLETSLLLDDLNNRSGPALFWLEVESDGSSIVSVIRFREELFGVDLVFQHIIAFGNASHFDELAGELRAILVGPAGGETLILTARSVDGTASSGDELLNIDYAEPLLAA